MCASQLLLPYSLPHRAHFMCQIVAKGWVVLFAVVLRSSSCRLRFASPASIVMPIEGAVVVR